MMTTPGPTTDNAEVPRFIDRDRVCELLGNVTASHVEHLRRSDPSFPRPIKLGRSFNSAKRWNESEILAWMRRRIEAREADNAAASKRGRALARVSLASPKRKAKLRLRRLAK